MKRILLLSLAVVSGMTACRDQPTQPEIAGPSRNAISSDAGIPAPTVYYVLKDGNLTLNWSWGDDQAWDLVSFDLSVDGKEVKGDWTIKPYTANEAGIYSSHAFSWNGSSFGQTAPPVCVSVMGKNRSGKGTATTTYHAKNCNPVPPPTAGGPPLRPETISSGYNFACGLTFSGEAYCWGTNAYGQLGDGTTTSRRTAWPVSGGLLFSQISAGGWGRGSFGLDHAGHTCALTSSGLAYCWGHNGNGQLGDGTNVDRHTPTPVSGGLQFTQITVGLAYTCGITAARDAYCWGYNTSGQLGDGTTAGRWTPTPVSGGLKFVQISAGGMSALEGLIGHTCGVATTGAAYCWGKNTSGETGNGVYPSFPSGNFPSPVLVVGGLTFSSVSAGGEHTCGVSTTGAAYCWGMGLGGQLGNGAYSAPVTSPSAVVGGGTFLQISAGDYYTCGIATSGMAYCWGHNDEGEAGNGSINNVNANPSPVAGGFSFTRISAGNTHTCGVTPTGAAHCWGDNFYGQVGDGTSSPNRLSPSPVRANPDFEFVAAGSEHACGLTSGGGAYCWGNNQLGQLGDGTTSNRTMAMLAETGARFIQISAGIFHSCGLTPEGSAYCWGWNLYGQLGDGTNTDRATPTPVAGGVIFSRIDVGGEHTCGLTSSGAAYCWGRNSGGQLGDGTATGRVIPTPVSGGFTFQQISSGTAHTCALTTSGAAYCWGQDGVIEYHSPALVSGGLAFTQLGTGDRYTCGLTNSGAAYCWGANTDGQLGDGTTNNKPFPTLLLGGPTFTQLAVGNTHACGVTAAGAAYCWGWNLYGQLGDGSTTNRYTATPVLGGLNLERIAAGDDFSCGSDASGITYCWGRNNWGQLSDGTTTNRSTPGIVIGWLVFRS